MIHRSSTRLSHAAPFSKTAADLCDQGMRSFKNSRKLGNQHNTSGIAPAGCEKEADGAGTKPSPRYVSKKTGVFCQALVIDFQ